MSQYNHQLPPPPIPSSSKQTPLHNPPSTTPTRPRASSRSVHRRPSNGTTGNFNIASSPVKGILNTSSPAPSSFKSPTGQPSSYPGQYPSHVGGTGTAPAPPFKKYNQEGYPITAQPSSSYPTSSSSSTSTQSPSKTRPLPQPQPPQIKVDNLGVTAHLPPGASPSKYSFDERYNNVPMLSPSRSAPSPPVKLSSSGSSGKLGNGAGSWAEKVGWNPEEESNSQNNFSFKEPPLIPQLPPSPSLDIGFFSGDSSSHSSQPRSLSSSRLPGSNSNNSLAPQQQQPGYFPPVPAPPPRRQPTSPSHPLPQPPPKPSPNSVAGSSSSLSSSVGYSESRETGGGTGTDMTSVRSKDSGTSSRNRGTEVGYGGGGNLPRSSSMTSSQGGSSNLTTSSTGTGRNFSQQREGETPRAKERPNERNRDVRRGSADGSDVSRESKDSGYSGTGERERQQQQQQQQLQQGRRGTPPPGAITLNSPIDSRPSITSPLSGKKPSSSVRSSPQGPSPKLGVPTSTSSSPQFSASHRAPSPLSTSVGSNGRSLSSSPASDGVFLMSNGSAPRQELSRLNIGNSLQGSRASPESSWSNNATPNSNAPGISGYNSSASGGSRSRNHSVDSTGSSPGIMDSTTTTPTAANTRNTHKDLPPIQTRSPTKGGPPPAYLSLGNRYPSEKPASVTSGMVSRPPRSASLSTGGQGSTAQPQPQPRNFSALPIMNSSTLVTSPQDEKSATSHAVDSMFQEMANDRSLNLTLKSPVLANGSGRSSPISNGNPPSPRGSPGRGSPGRGSPGIMDRPRHSGGKTPIQILQPGFGRSPNLLQGEFGGNKRLHPSRYLAMHRAMHRRRRKGKATLDHILVEEAIQTSLLPFFPIASFLALLGAIGPNVRRKVSGEIVGRWVCREWSLTLEGNEAWPGLGVWEGYLESLLHDSEAFPTYPGHFRPLLQHLSLSHSLIALFLRTLPVDVFPSPAPFPWEDDGATAAIGMPNSVSQLSMGSLAYRARVASSNTNAAGEYAPVPKAERLFELVMPEPLGTTKPVEEEVAVVVPPPSSSVLTKKRRGSISSNFSVNWGKDGGRSGSISSQSQASPFLGVPGIDVGSSPQGGSHKTPLPPVSFPSAKRYVFRGYPDAMSSGSSPRSRASSESGRPGSIFSVDDTLSMSGGHTLPGLPRGFSRHRRSGSDAGSAAPRSMSGRHSPTTSSNLRMTGSRTATSSPTASRYFRPDLFLPAEPIEPAFQKPLPFVVGRAPVLRVFVPLSEEVPMWPCAEGARRARMELERAGAWGKLKLGDIIVNTGITNPLKGRHLMIFVPTMQPFLVPLEYRYSEAGHLPSYVDSFLIPPSYFYPILPLPQIVVLDLSPWAESALTTLRLAFDRRDITTARGEKVVAKRYLHVAGFQISPQQRFSACEEWEGMVTLESEGTAEGRAEMLKRFGRAGVEESRVKPVRGAWEVLREKSLGGSVWLKLIVDPGNPMSPTSPR